MKRGGRNVTGLSEWKTLPNAKAVHPKFKAWESTAASRWVTKKTINFFLQITKKRIKERLKFNNRKLHLETNKSNAVDVKNKRMLFLWP